MSRTLTSALALLAALGTASTTTAAPVNVAQGQAVTLNGTYGVLTNPCCGWSAVAPVATGPTLVDGTLLPAATVWQLGTVWWDATTPTSAANSIVVDFGTSRELIGFSVQADDNDTYRIETWTGAAWTTAWNIPAVGGFGMQARPTPGNPTDIFFLGSPIATSRIRFTATGGDGFYSVSEIRAFAAPEPIPVLLLSVAAGAVVFRAARRKHFVGRA